MSDTRGQSATTDINPATAQAPKKLRRLTLKQRIFANEYMKTKNGTKAAMKAYDKMKPETARVIASENLTKTNVHNYIEQAIKKAKYDPVVTINHLQSTESKGYQAKATVKDALHASEILLKLSGALIDKSQSTSLNLNIDSLDPHDLLILKKKYDRLLEG